MSSFQLETDASDPFYGDLKLTANSLTLTTGTEAIRQHLQCRFQLFFGEWFLDTEVGVPWFQDILGNKSSFVVVQEVLKGVVLDTPGVLQLLTFNFDYTASTREITLSFQCLSTEGVIDFTLLNPNGNTNQ